MSEIRGVADVYQTPKVEDALKRQRAVREYLEQPDEAAKAAALKRIKDRRNQECWDRVRKSRESEQNRLMELSDSSTDDESEDDLEGVPLTPDSCRCRKCSGEKGR